MRVILTALLITAIISCSKNYDSIGWKYFDETKLTVATEDFGDDELPLLIVKKVEQISMNSRSAYHITEEGDILIRIEIGNSVSIYKYDLVNSEFVLIED